VDGAVREINELFRVAKRERRVTAPVSGIGRCGRVAFLQRGCHRRVADHAGPPAIADGLELAVPRVGRHPDFDLDFGIGRRP
jgi:hypothetical protein